MKKSYVEYILEVISGYPYGMPIYTKRIALNLASEYELSEKEACAATAVVIKRILENKSNKDLRFYNKGVYYLAKKTPFGETQINKEQLFFDKYLANNTGYETGACLLHRMGLMTWMPNRREIVSNAANGRRVIVEERNTIVYPAKAKITARNKDYFQILDALNTLDTAPVDVESPYAVIYSHIKNRGLELEKLLLYANKLYNRNTVLQLAKMVEAAVLEDEEEEYEFTSR